MITELFAEAGLSECARDAACSAEFNHSVYILLAKAAVAGLWFVTTFAATVSVGLSDMEPRRSGLWMLAVWFVPFMGQAFWWRHRRRLIRSLPPLSDDALSQPNRGRRRSW
ncbi:hypothetical protein ASG12_08745 [Williamsia sp. Leaf354]|uniref:hypothetical protein n=1 Tax=Williamsia sp. Leaf354 TaxID=1736349 RepID=UPI0006FBB13E|nr:hypothetical protein [Williamsia sp. Leaf354]KQR98517.1 hypothetical protein ASG12_08745 [Williamsia sp. Leaf354]